MQTSISDDKAAGSNATAHGYRKAASCCKGTYSKECIAQWLEHPAWPGGAGPNPDTTMVP